MKRKSWSHSLGQKTSTATTTPRGFRDESLLRLVNCASLLILAMALVSASVARADDIKAPSGDAHARGVALLGRIQDAAQHQNYVGTFVYQEGAQMQSSRITHLAESSGELEKLEILDGKLREFIRHDDEVRCYIPDSKVVLVETNAKTDKFPALLTSPASDVEAHYVISRGPVERVAGRNCVLISLTPRDALRYGYRLWIDEQTSLLLKAQTVDQHGSVLEQVAFTDIQIGGHIDRAQLRPSSAATEGWRTETYSSEPVELEKQGWTLADQLPGFKEIREINRTFGSGRQVGQIVISDGLAAISIFIEPAGAPGQTEGDAQKGPINIVSKRYGDHWLTIVGEAPRDTIHKVADSVEFHPPQ